MFCEIQMFCEMQMFYEIYDETKTHNNGADYFRQKSLLILGQHPIWESTALESSPFHMGTRGDSSVHREDGQQSPRQ